MDSLHKQSFAFIDLNFRANDIVSQKLSAKGANPAVQVDVGLNGQVAVVFVVDAATVVVALAAFVAR